MKREMSVCGSPPPVTCGLFPETPVVTLEGILPAGYLSPGDRIVTRSGGAAPLRAVVLGPCTLAPVLLRAGALGAGMPVSDIRLAPDQEVLVRGDIARRFFGTSEGAPAGPQAPGRRTAARNAAAVPAHTAFRSAARVLRRGRGACQRRAHRTAAPPFRGRGRCRRPVRRRRDSSAIRPGPKLRAHSA